MKLNIPIYVEERRQEAGERHFFARPLFFAEPCRRGGQLKGTLTRLKSEIQKELNQFGRQGRQDKLVEWSYHPPFKEEILDLTLRLKNSTQRGRFLFVLLDSFEHTVAFTPGLAEFAFELHRGQKLEDRAVEVLTHHFRALEKQDPEFTVQIREYSLSGPARVEVMELDVPMTTRLPDPPPDLFAILAEEPILTGREELEKAGRCLDGLYPDELERAILREAEVEELSRLLTAPDRRPVLLVGPPKCGKTTLIHEYIHRKGHLRKPRHEATGQVWLLSPARLVSGMSCLGQWENRMLAILSHAAQRSQILYFDDLLGLFLAGISAQSNLSVAHLLKNFLEKRTFRMLAEITPAAFRILQERDRSFADLFHILPVRETTPVETRKIAIAIQRQLENQHQCRFSLEVIPAVLDLQARYASELAFPGKAAGFLRQLAVKFARNDITRREVLDEFQQKSGLAGCFLDQREVLSKADVMRRMGFQVKGQTAALEALAEVLAIARARLNDPSRPLASLLFLGPTGVGKTECAKAAARFLFNDPARLVRFDMNEYGEPGSAARLVGSFNQPEGLLTSAIRRQPFAVVLLDEIEKAHPEVFDLLLGVLGEGRLTDALGRTASFAQCVIILTSNLGTRDARSSLGFNASGILQDQVYREAAEKYFRPEFFNRLDRIIPFHALTREHLNSIASRVLWSVLGRSGLARRRCLVSVQPEARQWLVDQGFQPALGARALKRILERQLVQPVARRLAALEPRRVTLIDISLGQGELATLTRSIPEAERIVIPGLEIQAMEVARLLAQARKALQRMDCQLDAIQPSTPLNLFALDTGQRHYFAARDQASQLRNKLLALDRIWTTTQSAVPGFVQNLVPGKVQAGSKKAPLNWDAKTGPFLQDYASQLDILDYIDEIQESAVPDEAAYKQSLRNLILEIAWLESLLQPRSSQRDRCLLWFEDLCNYVDSEQDLITVLSPYRKCIETLSGYECHRWDGEIKELRDASGKCEEELSRLNPDIPEAQARRRQIEENKRALDLRIQTRCQCLLVTGPNSAGLLRAETGAILFRSYLSSLLDDDQLLMVQVHSIPLEDGQDVWAALAAFRQLRETGRPAGTGGSGQELASRAQVGPIIRMLGCLSGEAAEVIPSSEVVGPASDAEAQNDLVDLRSGWWLKGDKAIASGFLYVLLSRLPLPEEFRQGADQAKPLAGAGGEKPV